MAGIYMLRCLMIDFADLEVISDFFCYVMDG